MEKFFRFTRSIIGMLIVSMSFAFLFILCYKAIPEENQDILKVAAGLVLAALGFVAGYYFGSSKDKSDLEESQRP